MNAQLLVRLNEPEVCEAGGVRERHTWRQLLPARIVCKIGIRSVLAQKLLVRVEAVLDQRYIKIGFEGRASLILP